MDEHNGVSRRGFLKLAAGSALGAAILSVPALSLASELTGGATTVKRKLVPVTLKGLPRDAMAAAKASTLVYDSFSSIISISQKISDASLRSAVLKLLNDPTPTFMANYPGQSSISRLYSQLASAGLIDTSKIDVAHLLPPYNGSVQPFRTATAAITPIPVAWLRTWASICTLRRIFAIRIKKSLATMSTAMWPWLARPCTISVSLSSFSGSRTEPP